jgi:APA family basic amino acid/polyamine antiporter
LHRRLGVRDAVVVGLGSMIGAGVFAAFTPAAAAAGSGLLVGLVVAAVVAWCNATASAQLAAQYPTSGGTYVYGRERLGPWWGFVAGWGFVVGKTASCAAMALTVATYALGGDARATRLLAIAAVVGLTVVNLRGITKTARLATVLVLLTVGILGVTLVLIGVGNRTWHSPFESFGDTSAYGILQSAGLLFFAFAGYARIATLGEEVRDPATTIPRAIPRALGLVVVLYAVVAVVLLAVLGPSGVAASDLPLVAAAEQAGVGWAGGLVRVGAVLASLGSLLGLVAGVSRTMLAMARTGDLPRPLAQVDERRGVPQTAEVVVCAVVVLLVVAFDVRAVIGFSSFGVLVYYAVANASAFTQDAAHRRWSRGWQVFGLLGCLLLVVTLPRAAVLTGVCVFALGLLGRLFTLRVLRR